MNRFLVSVAIVSTLVAGCTPGSQPAQEEAQKRQLYNISMVDQQFVPNYIAVNFDDLTTLSVTSPEAGTLSIAGYNIERDLNFNRETDITFVASRAGTYELRFTPLDSDVEVLVGTLYVRPSASAEPTVE